MWTEDHKGSDANHIGWINLIQSNTTHCAKLGIMRMQESYIDTFTAQVAAPGLFGGFSFHGSKKQKVRGFMKPLNRIMSVYGLSRTVVLHTVANSRLTPLMAHHKLLLVVPKFARVFVINR